MNLFIIALLTLAGITAVLAFLGIRLDQDYQKDVKRLTRQGMKQFNKQTTDPKH